MTKWGCMIALALLVAGCGGSGGPSLPGQPPDDPVAAVLLSDFLFSGPGDTNERAENIACTADLAQCTATFRGISLSFSADPTAAAGESTAYTSLGAWTHMSPVVVEVAAEEWQGRLAALSGRTYANSLPVMGSATWQGTMVALDRNHQLVRGGGHAHHRRSREASRRCRTHARRARRPDLERATRPQRRVRGACLRLRLHQGRVLRPGGGGGGRRLRAEPTPRGLRRHAVTHRLEGGHGRGGLAHVLLVWRNGGATGPALDASARDGAALPSLRRDQLSGLTQ